MGFIGWVEVEWISTHFLAKVCSTIFSIYLVVSFSDCLLLIFPFCDCFSDYSNSLVDFSWDSPPELALEFS